MKSMSRRLKGRKNVSSGKKKTKKPPKSKQYRKSSSSTRSDPSDDVFTGLNSQTLLELLGKGSFVRFAQLGAAAYLTYITFGYVFLTGDDKITLECERVGFKTNQYDCSQYGYRFGPHGETKLSGVIINQGTMATVTMSTVAWVWKYMSQVWKTTTFFAIVTYFTWDKKWTAQLLSGFGFGSGSRRKSVSSRDLKHVLNNTAQRIQTPKPHRKARKAPDTTDDEAEDSSDSSSEDSSSGDSDSDDSSDSSSSD